MGFRLRGAYGVTSGVAMVKAHQGPVLRPLVAAQYQEEESGQVWPVALKSTTRSRMTSEAKRQAAGPPVAIFGLMAAGPAAIITDGHQAGPGAKRRSTS